MEFTTSLKPEMNCASISGFRDVVLDCSQAEVKMPYDTSVLSGLPT